MTTDFSKRIEILGDFYFIYKDDEELKDFFEFNDLGLPLAYLAKEGLCTVSEEGFKYINETWDILMAALSIEDIGFNDINNMMGYVEKEQGE